MICTDGAQAMVGKQGKLQALVKHVFPNLQCTQCMMHWEALESKEMSPKLKDVMQVIIVTRNYIKTRPVNFSTVQINGI